MSDPRRGAFCVIRTATVPRWFVEALAEVPIVDSVTVAGVEVVYRTWGSSSSGHPDLLLVHGGAANARWWDHLAPALATNRRVTVIDLSGHGESGHRAAYSLDGWADELAAVIYAAQLSTPVVAGHSLGGIITTVMARRGHPALSGAIIIDSPIEPAGPPARAEFEAIAFSQARVYPTQAEAAQRFRPVPAQDVLDFVADHIATESLREVRGGWSWKFDPAFMRMDGELPRTLSGLPCPVVLIMGEWGILSPRARRAMVTSADVVVIEVPRAGHAIMLDRPLELLASIRSALAGWTTPGE